MAFAAQSERQAVNTTIQGSAADLAKLAMVQIQVALRETFPTAPTCLITSQLSSCQEVSRGAHLVLHLHDELMYEVRPKTRHTKVHGDITLPSPSGPCLFVGEYTDPSLLFCLLLRTTGITVVEFL